MAKHQILILITQIHGTDLPGSDSKTVPSSYFGLLQREFGSDLTKTEAYPSEVWPIGRHWVGVDRNFQRENSVDLAEIRPDQVQKYSTIQ